MGAPAAGGMAGASVLLCIGPHETSIHRMTSIAANSKTRVNARIDSIAEAQLQYVTQHTEMTVTEALKSAIALLYDKVSRECLRPADVLRNRPSFVAMGESGLHDGSETYKSVLAESWARKAVTDADR